MSKNVLAILVFSFFVTILWIGYSIYSAFFVDKYTATNEDISKYLESVNTNMHIDALNNVNDLGKNIRVSDNTLK